MSCVVARRQAPAALADLGDGHGRVGRAERLAVDRLGEDRLEQAHTITLATITSAMGFVSCPDHIVR